MIHHLFPTKRNGFIPHLLRERHIVVMLGLGVALFSLVQLTRLSNYFGLTADVYPAVVFALTNEDRAKNNLSTLSVNTTLEAAAKLKAEDMAKKGYFAHTSPEGLTPWHWFNVAGYKFIYAGENLAINYSESDAVQEAWLSSPTHRANIMNENFTEIGIATATGTYNGAPATFVVELFGMPATARATTASSAPLPQTPASQTAPTVSGSQTAAAPAAQDQADIAGEVVPTLTVLEETPTYSMAQQTDPTLEPGNPQIAPAPKVSWVQRLIINSDKIAGLIMQIIIIGAIIATTGMIAREYEKHHRKHMAYGVLVAVIMFAFLFVGRIGVFSEARPPLAAALESVELPRN